MRIGSWAVPLMIWVVAGGTGAEAQAPGQAAFGAIAEIVRILESDPSTDWSKVNLEALRIHLADMDEVVLRSQVTHRIIPGGFEATVTGGASTAAAIHRMVVPHSGMLGAEPGYRSAVAILPDGVRLTVTAADPADQARVARIRGLGFAGTLTVGDHHARHHLALARGDGAAHHH